MTRTETIAEIQATLPTLADEHVDQLYALLLAWAQPILFDTLSDAEKAEIDAALDRLDAGQSIPAETVFATFARKLNAAL